MEQLERSTIRNGTNVKVIDGQSEASRRFTSSLFYKVMAPIMARVLDSPVRRLLNDAERTLDGAGIKPGMNVLEVGCGTGYFTLPAARRLGETGHLHATDISPEAAQFVRNRIAGSGLQNVSVGVVDAKATGLPDEAYDMVLIFGVIPAPMLPLNELLPEMHRVLKMDGVLVIWPNVPVWMRRAFGKSGLFSYEENYNGVLRFRKI